jgi:hypothetical protein
MAAVLVCLATPASFCQQVRDEGYLTIRILDAKSGNPMASTHVLVFLGNSADEVRFHKGHADTNTDAKGVVVIPMNFSIVRFAQVWVDRYSRCEKHPNLESFRVDDVHRRGLSLNTCSSLKSELKPDEVTVYVRPDTRAEKMRQ